MDLVNLLSSVCSMIGNYSERVVERTEEEGFVVDTALVTDMSYTYETAVYSRYFNDSRWIIVAGTNTKEEACKAHDKWVESMRSGTKVLYDIIKEEVYVREKNLIFRR